MSDQQTAQPLPPQVQPLAAFASGQGAILTAIAGGRKLQERLVALGLYPGQRLTVCQNNGSSLLVSLNGNRLALGRGVSQKILAMPTVHCCRQADDCPCPAQDVGNFV